MTDILYHHAAIETEPAELELRIKVPHSERYRLQLALAAPKMLADFSAFHQNFRNLIKYNEGNYDKVYQLYAALCDLVVKYEELSE